MLHNSLMTYAFILSSSACVLYEFYKIVGGKKETKKETNKKKYFAMSNRAVFELNVPHTRYTLM